MGMDVMKNLSKFIVCINFPLMIIVYTKLVNRMWVECEHFVNFPGNSIRIGKDFSKKEYGIAFFKKRMYN